MNTIQAEFTLQEKLHILSDAAKYDVACTSSGSDRRGKKGFLGNAVSAGICHSFSSDGRCISLLKILLTNECIYDCKYCINRSSNDQMRTAFTPEEICTLVIEFYRRNYIEGLFLSSGIMKSPDYTMEQIYRTLLLLRSVYRFNGYIHVKAIPGASEELITRTGYLADRMSVNLELPTADSLRQLAPHKKPEHLLRPIRQIRDGIMDHRLSEGRSPLLERSRSNRYLNHSIFRDNPYGKLESQVSQTFRPSLSPAAASGQSPAAFVPAGQSTQMIIGASGESDLQLLTTAQSLYQQYDLKRVFFSAYVALNEDAILPEPGTPPPLLREHRLYQADWLLRFYGFHARELLDEEHPNFNIMLDPKCDWALRHLELFPVEINTADYAMLLRVPGLGTKSAMRIIKARKQSLLDFPHLKKIGVVLKRARYFITCKGRMMDSIPVHEDFITRQLLGEEKRQNWEIEHPQTYRQLSLFDDFHFHSEPTDTDTQKACLGQL